MLNEIRSVFCGYFCSEEETAGVIKKTFENDGYLVDTHTAVGLGCAEKYIAETGDKTKIILASTASPYKFAADVCKSIGVDSESLEGEALIRKLSEATSTEIPAPLLRTLSLPVRFTKVVKKTEMADVVFEK